MDLSDVTCAGCKCGINQAVLPGSALFYPAALYIKYRINCIVVVLFCCFTSTVNI